MMSFKGAMAQAYYYSLAQPESVIYHERVKDSDHKRYHTEDCPYRPKLLEFAFKVYNDLGHYIACTCHCARKPNKVIVSYPDDSGYNKEDFSEYVQQLSEDVHKELIDHLYVKELARPMEDYGVASFYTYHLESINMRRTKGIVGYRIIINLFPINNPGE